MTKVHTPEPGNEHPGAAGALAGPLLSRDTTAGPEVAASRPPTPILGRWPVLETSAGADALAYGREREHRAQANEDAATDYLDWRDLFLLRRIAALHQTIFPGPHDDPLASV